MILVERSKRQTGTPLRMTPFFTHFPFFVKLVHPGFPLGIKQTVMLSGGSPEFISGSKYNGDTRNYPSTTEEKERYKVVRL